MKTWLTVSGAVMTLTAVYAPAWAQQGDGFYGPHNMGWSGWFVGPIMMIFWVGLLVAAIVVILRLLGVTASHQSHQSPDRSAAILRERFARGEIDAAEFEERKKLLE